MDAERYQEVKALLLRALDLPTEARDNFVKQACDGDDELREEVLSLLREDDAPARIVDVGFLGTGSDALDWIGALEPDSEVSTPRIGMRFEQFELIRELGRGGMGQVFLAKDTKLGRRVALKFLRLRSSELIARFLAEARATAKCHHENIVVIYQADEALGLPYLALEYLEGEPLSELMKRGPLPPQRAVSIIVQVVRALVCAHELGIVHRDLKPDNIFLTATGQVKVLDFGIAKLFDDTITGGGDIDPVSGAFEITQGGAVLGTIPYMSPEQWGIGDVDHRTDLWAVGIILWQLLVGTHPVPSPTFPLLRDIAHRTDEPMPHVRAAAPHVSAELADVVDACLVKQKHDRVASARVLLELLEPLMASGTADADTPKPLVLRATPVQAWAVMFILGWILLGMSIGLGVGRSYTASINWGPNFIVVIPFLAAACVRAVQEADEALRGMSRLRILVDETGRPTVHNLVFETWRERLRWSPVMVGIAMTGSIAVSFAEWWTRWHNNPVQTQWWTASPVLGASGAFVQGLIIGTMVITGVVVVTFGWTVLDLAAGRLGVRARFDPHAEDGRGGFGIFRLPLEALVGAVPLFFVALWMSHVQHIAIARGVGLDTVLFEGPLFAMGPALYTSQMNIIAMFTVVALVGLTFFWVHRTYWSIPAPVDARAPWLVPYLPLPTLALAFSATLMGFVFYRLGLVIIGLVFLAFVMVARRALSPH